MKTEKYLWFYLLLVVNVVYAQTEKVIYPGAVWPDKNGNHIQAHGGGIIQLGKYYYWYGEQRGKEFAQDTVHRYVSCYQSEDLVNWEFKGNALKLADPENLGKKWVLERPKVFYNKGTNTYVMYFHLDDTKYQFARVGVATSQAPEGPFVYQHSFRPLDKESRDIGQFIDDDGTPYLIFESRPTKGFFITSLSSDYLHVDKEICLVHAPLEGGAIVNYEGIYYAIGSALTSWWPNPNKYATAKSLSGPWSEFKDIAPPETKTYHSQSTMMIKIKGTGKTSVIFMADQWRPATQWDSRYLWMPLEISDGKLWLPKPRPFSLNVETGETEILEK